MGNKIFVGGLNWRTTEPDLKAAFSRYADVASVRIIIDRETGRSKCFGFVEFTDVGAVPELIEKCDGMKLDGRHIKVSMARERPTPVRSEAENTSEIPGEDKGTPEAKPAVEELEPESKPEVQVEPTEVKAQAEHQENGEANAHV